MNLEHRAVTRRLGLAGGIAAGIATSLIIASPAAADQLSAVVANDVLTVKGSSSDDRIALRLAAGAPGTLQVDFGDDAPAEFSFDRTTFSRINVLTRDGNDQFRVDQANGAFADEALTVEGGSGNDILDGGDQVELFIAGAGNDAVDGNRGNDTAQLGSGQDSFRWDPGDGSDVVEGQFGFDTLDFNGAAVAENMSLSADGGRSVFLRDAGNIRMDMDDVEGLDLTTLGAVDTFVLNDMSGTDFKAANVDLSGPAGGGDAAADVVTVNATNDDDEIEVTADGAAVEVDGLKTTLRLTGSETIDDLRINTLDGDDEVAVDNAVAALIEVLVDLGVGQS